MTDSGPGPAMGHKPWRPSGTCSFFLCDIASFSDPARSDAAREHVRKAMYGFVEQSLLEAGVVLDDPGQCYHEDRGDGVMVVLPPKVDVDALLTRVVEALRTKMRRHNELSSSMAQMRMRIAVHVGEVRSDERGLNGTDLIHAFRLLDAAELKRTVERAPVPLAIIVSGRVYSDVVRRGLGHSDPGDYRGVEVNVKETTGAAAWIRVPGVRPAATDAGTSTEVTSRDPAEAGTGAAVAAATGGTGPGPQMPFPGHLGENDLVFQLVDDLMGVTWLRGEYNRDRLAGALSLEIAGAIPRSPEAKSDLHAIVSTCLDYPGGLQQLYSAVRHFIGGSMQVLKLEKTIALLLAREPGTPGTPT